MSDNARLQAMGPLNAGDPLNAGLMFFLIFPTRVKSFPVILTIGWNGAKLAVLRVF